MRGATAGTPLRFRRLRWAVPIAAVALLSLGASARAATVTVGSPLTHAFISTPYPFTTLTVANTALPEPGAHVTSPISGTIVRWRVLDAQGGPFRLRVLRPAGGISYTGAGTSGPETPSSTSLQTFAANLPIQAGDTIGLDNDSGLAQLGIAVLPGTGYEYVIWDPPLADGSTRPPNTPSSPEEELAFNADVQPRPSVSSISPASGPYTGGTAVTIAGSDFADVSAVNFGGVPAAGYSVNSEDRIVATSPVVPPGPVDVTVTTVAGRSATGAGDVFTFLAPPPLVAKPVCVVPKLKRRRLRPAKRVLRKRHCRIGKVIRKHRKKAPRKARVIKQRPRPRTIRPAGTKVHVWLRVRKKAQRKKAR
jgi:hypothetical protein